MFRSRDIEIFVFFLKPADFKIRDVIISIAANLCLFLLNPKFYQNEIWSNNSVLYDKHFYHVFGWMLETGN